MSELNQFLAQGGGGIKSIQRIALTSINGSSYQNVTIAKVDMNKTVVNITCQPINIVTGWIQSLPTSGSSKIAENFATLTSQTNLRVLWYAFWLDQEGLHATGCDFYAEVIEYV